MAKFDLEKRMAEIAACEPEEPSADDLAAIEAAKKEKPEERMSLEAYMAAREYSGSLTLRIPKELHRQLALDAKRNGVSLNQYALYKLSRS